MKIVLTACACLLLLAMARGAHAQDAARPVDSAETAEARGARAFFEIGAQAYERGDYDGALEAFREAYERAARPGLLFSMAQAHRRAFFVSNEPAHLAEAVDLYRKYLESGDAARRRDAEEALVELVPLTTTVAPTPNGVPAAPRASRLMVASSTPGAKLYIDGAPAPHLPYVASVEPGTHTLTLTAPGYRRHERTIPVPEGAAFALDIPLEELPGTLALTGTAGSEVLIDGRLVGALPMPPLPVEAGRHRLTVQKSGHRLSNRSFEVQHGRSVHIDAPLSVSSQRKASVGLLWAGGLSLLTASVLGVAALDRQAEAKLYLDLRNDRPLTVAERERHNHAVQVRDRLRRGTVSMGTLGAATVLIGVALLAFDRPRPPPMLEQAPEQAPEQGPTHRELIAGPSWDMDHIGVTARGTF